MNVDNMNKIEEGYFNYLANKIIKSVMDANDYQCKDFVALKLSFLMDLCTMLESKETFEKIMKLLNENDRGVVYEKNIN